MNLAVNDYAPSLQSVPEKYINDPVTAAYASNMEEFILNHQPDFLDSYSYSYTKQLFDRENRGYLQPSWIYR